MHDAATRSDSKGQYFWVWGALLVLTAVEVMLGYKQIFARSAPRVVDHQIGAHHWLLHAPEIRDGIDALDAGDLGDGLLHHYVFLFLPRRGTNFKVGSAVGDEIWRDISSGCFSVAGRALDGAGVGTGLRHV
jgi:hypothetical protein